MCESMDPGKYSRRKASIADEGKEKPEEKIKDTFHQALSGHNSQAH